MVIGMGGARFAKVAMDGVSCWGGQEGGEGWVRDGGREDGDKRGGRGWRIFTGIALVGIHFGGTLCEVDVGFLAYLVHGVFAAADDFAGVAVASRGRISRQLIFTHVDVRRRRCQRKSWWYSVIAHLVGFRRAMSRYGYSRQMGWRQDHRYRSGRQVTYQRIWLSSASLTVHSRSPQWQRPV